MSSSATTNSSASTRHDSHCRQSSASRIPVRSPRKLLHRTSESSINTQSADGGLSPANISPQSKTKSKSPTTSPARAPPPPRQLSFTPWHHASRLPVRTPKASVSSSTSNDSEMALSKSSDSLDSVDAETAPSARPMVSSPSGRDMTAALLELEQELPSDDEFLVVWRATSALSLGERVFQ
ncbi:hypothetical protein CYLTODRAFT_106213 [Cylindrobasidium torrendii FP15055 ss-10]|uniref:Uncharacterized protein n=1 Tax=Cylindrobasidium torrendii FP15055 ss-10 TaxID=1314674 RepID=A0A0D7B291_9AGAR|nr:hypothetical protein CYLTODRAFT_106213 [Cylindrobasidium torrendii FP15055 ss-10]